MIENKEKPLAGMSIQTATPCGDGRYVRGYVSSFHNTQCVLIELGAKVDFAEMPFVSDIGLARSKIFGNFLRSQHTHLFLVDSDMIWSFHDVVRLILAKKDFVAAAGPKKRWPIEFAANNCSDDGELLKVEWHADTGLVRCTEVGLAFALITKECAQKMADAYQDLKFPGDAGTDEFAIFDSFIVGKGPRRRRLSEDFAFCHRWRRIGGEIFLLPDVKLGHVGSHTWEGALIDALMGTPLDETQKAG
jgi:hypothetical protein